MIMYQSPFSSGSSLLVYEQDFVRDQRKINYHRTGDIEIDLGRRVINRDFKTRLTTHENAVLQYH